MSLYSLSGALCSVLGALYSLSGLCFVCWGFVLSVGALYCLLGSGFSPGLIGGPPLLLGHGAHGPISFHQLLHTKSPIYMPVSLFFTFSLRFAKRRVCKKYNPTTHLTNSSIKVLEKGTSVHTF